MAERDRRQPPPQGDVPGSWSREHLDALPLWTLVQAFHAVAGRLYALFARHGLTPTQFGVLAQLASGAVESQAELARRVLVTPQSLQLVVAELHGRGLLDVAGPGGRGRRKKLMLTQRGWELISRVRPELEKANAPASLGLQAVECAQLNRSLHALLRHFESQP